MEAIEFMQQSGKPAVGLQKTIFFCEIESNKLYLDDIFQALALRVFLFQ